MTGAGRVGVGVIGAGVISDQYLTNLSTFPDLEVLFVADLDEPRAKAQAEKYGVPGSGSVDELLAHEGIEIVVNLTIPIAHVEIALRAVAAGKNVWSEKPFSLDRESGQQLLAAAKERGVRVACAPDTFLGAGLQTGKRVIERGDIGTPLTAITLFQTPGPESWHPNPEFLFAPGAGPMFDVGPYYITTLVQNLGPVAKVTALASKAKETRVIGSGPKAGTEFPVTVPTHVSALIQFENGASAQSVFSFDSQLRRAGFVEIAGTAGTVVFPDPNNFDGDVTVWTAASEEAVTVPAEGSKATRGTGVAELAQAIRGDRVEQAPGELAYHVLDIMVSLAESAEKGESVVVQSTVTPSALLPEGWDPTVATLG
jgi:predicted dehydrogenase